MWRLSAASEQRVPGEFSGVRLAPGEMSSCRSSMVNRYESTEVRPFRA